MQGFGFLSAILVSQNWKRATTTDGEVPPSFNLARFDLKKYCCLKLFTNKECDYFSHSICSFYQLYFKWNNFSIKFVNWLFSMIAKSSFETSPKQPRTTWHHNAAVMYVISGFVTSWMWCIATVVCCPCKVPQLDAIRQDNLGKYTSSRELYTNCRKNLWTFYFETWNSHQECHRKYT